MRRGLTKVQVVLSVVAAAVVVFAAVLAIRSRDIQDEPPEIADRVWSTRVDGSSLMVYVTHEQRSKSVPLLGGSDDYTYKPYARYALVVRRIPDGSLVSSLHLADIEDHNREEPRIIGFVGDVVWIWRDGVEARHLPDLAPRTDLATLNARAGDAASVLPAEADGYPVMPEPAALVVKGRDARFYTVDAATSSITTLDPARLPPTTSSMRVEDRFDYLRPAGEGRVVTQPSNAMQRSFLTSTGLWYALLSESERAGQSRWPQGPDHPSGDVARSLYRTAYRLDDRNVPEIVPASLTPVGDARLIQAGFLERTADRVWDVADPSSTLVLAKRALGAAEPWEVVRLARDGAVRWRTSTELAEPHQIIDLGSHVGFLGLEPTGSARTTERRQRLVWIDERTGDRRVLSVTTGEIGPVGKTIEAEEPRPRD